jgi:hypothetical protein
MGQYMPSVTTTADKPVACHGCVHNGSLEHEDGSAYRPRIFHNERSPYGGAKAGVLEQQNDADLVDPPTEAGHLWYSKLP